MYTDPRGNFILELTLGASILIGALIGGAVYTAYAIYNGNFTWEGLAKSIIVGAISGAATAGIGEIAQTIKVGKELGKGFVHGFLNGSINGAITGAFSSVISPLLNGDDITLKGFLTGIGIGAVVGGVIKGISEGSEALKAKANFWNGKIKLDMTKYFAADNISSDAQILKNTNASSIYKGKFHDVPVFETTLMDGGGVTLPPNGIVVPKGTGLNAPVIHHEYGHWLQWKRIGISAYYNVIAPESLMSSIVSENHREFWTEKWANYLSKEKLGTIPFPYSKYVENISNFNWLKIQLDWIKNPPIDLPFIK